MTLVNGFKDETSEDEYSIHFFAVRGWDVVSVVPSGDPVVPSCCTELVHIGVKEHCIQQPTHTVNLEKIEHTTTHACSTHDTEEVHVPGHKAVQSCKSCTDVHLRRALQSEENGNRQKSSMKRRSKDQFYKGTSQGSWNIPWHDGQRVEESVVSRYSNAKPTLRPPISPPEPLRLLNGTTKTKSKSRRCSLPCIAEAFTSASSGGHSGDSRCRKCGGSRLKVVPSHSEHAAVDNKLSHRRHRSSLQTLEVAPSLRLFHALTLSPRGPRTRSTVRSLCGAQACDFIEGKPGRSRGCLRVRHSHSQVKTKCRRCGGYRVKQKDE